MTVLRELKTHVSHSEKQILNLKAMVNDTTTTALMVNNADIASYPPAAAAALSHASLSLRILPFLLISLKLRRPLRTTVQCLHFLNGLGGVALDATGNIPTVIGNRSRRCFL